MEQGERLVVPKRGCVLGLYALWHCAKSANHQMDHESAMQRGETATTSIGSHIDVAVKRSYRD